VGYVVLVSAELFLFCVSIEARSQDSSVGITMDYLLDGQNSIPGEGNGFFSAPWCPEQLWEPPSFLFSGYKGCEVAGA
jgi:hypothetical protein